MRDLYNRKHKLAHWILKAKSELYEPDRAHVLQFIEYMREKDNSILWIVRCKKECDKLYDALEEDEKNDINSFEDGIISKETNKEDCEEDSGTWVDGKCDLDEEQY